MKAELRGKKAQRRLVQEPPRRSKRPVSASKLAAACPSCIVARGVGARKPVAQEGVDHESGGIELTILLAYEREAAGTGAVNGVLSGYAVTPSSHEPAQF